MMTRQKIVAGNWKMNFSLTEATSLVDAILSSVTNDESIIKIVIPPFTYIQTIGKQISNTPNFFVGAQNCYTHTNGAYTGEVSAAMLQSVGGSYVLVGHSERRLHFKENSTDLVLKIKEALLNNLKPIFCIGENLIERQNNTYFDVLKTQLTSVLSHFSLQEFAQFIIAYEPVWAIGTGQTATPEQAQQIHFFIRNLIADFYDSAIAAQVSILYGGSCNAQNAKQLFACPDIDGGLIGGASLKPIDFCSIINSF